MSTRKYINKQKKGLDAIKKPSGEDEWAHLSGSDNKKSVETKIENKIEAAEVADVGDRVVTFGKTMQKNLDSGTEKIRDHVRNAMDAAGNTGQYIKFVNNHIDSQRIEIEKIKKIKEKFDHEIDLLQSNRNKLDNLNSKKLADHDVSSISESLKQLLLEKGITKSKLDSLKNEITLIEEELKEQENQIEEVNDEIINNKEISDEENKEKQIKDDLELLMKKYNVSKLSDLEKIIK